MVEVEKVIGNKNEDATEGGRIDMTITVGSWLLIIENKIYAQDQDRQLLRYANYAKSSPKDYMLLYLTLDGKNASDRSTTDAQGNTAEYTPLSYKEHILAWLHQCVSMAYGKPLVRETLQCMSNADKSDGWWPYGYTALPAEIRNWTDCETFGNVEKCNRIISWLDQKIDEIVSEVEAKGIMTKEL